MEDGEIDEEGDGKKGDGVVASVGNNDDDSEKPKVVVPPSTGAASASSSSGTSTGVDVSSGAASANIPTPAAPTTQPSVPAQLNLSSLTEPDPPPQPPLDMETRTTIIIPSGYIPTTKPTRPRLWGGAAYSVRIRPPPTSARRKGNVGRRGSSRPAPATNTSSPSKQTNAQDATAPSTPTTANPPAATTRIKSESALRRSRRIYTDDSDLFLCAIHSGWITWSGAQRAKAKGRDLKVELRVMRAAGAGPTGVFARGVGGLEGPETDGGRIKEEVLGRFLGGFGERCMDLLGRVGGVCGEEQEAEEAVRIGMEIGGPGGVGLGRVKVGWGSALGVLDVVDPEEGKADGGNTTKTKEVLVALDDGEDDGRSMVSAAWGSGHDGSAIEIVNVEFVDRGTAQTSCNLGRRNRSQRLLEYAERRATVMGLSCSQPVSALPVKAPPSLNPGVMHHSSACLSRMVTRKRRRGWDGWPVHATKRRLPNASILDDIREEEELEDLDEIMERPSKRVCVERSREEKVMDLQTVVFGTKGGEVQPGFKYSSDAFKEILFPSPAIVSTLPAAWVRLPTASQTHDNPMTMDVDEPTTKDHTPSTQRNPETPSLSIILETAKEHYIFTPTSKPSSPEDDETPLPLMTNRTYDIGIVRDISSIQKETTPVPTTSNAATSTPPVPVTVPVVSIPPTKTPRRKGAETPEEGEIGEEGEFEDGEEEDHGEGDRAATPKPGNVGGSNDKETSSSSPLSVSALAKSLPDATTMGSSTAHAKEETAAGAMSPQDGKVVMVVKRGLAIDEIRLEDDHVVLTGDGAELTIRALCWRWSSKVVPPLASSTS